MKCLKINSGKGEFSVDGVNFVEIDKITKEDILKIVDITLDPKQTIEMDEDTGGLITNAAHKIVYSNLYDKFADLNKNKDQFVDETSELYRTAYEQYKLPDDEPKQEAGDV